jgi:septal ring factor EnvC (AmiA/AmiB activator)
MEDFMKNLSKIIATTMSVIVFTGLACSAETTFTPLNFSDGSSVTTSSSSTSTASSTAKGTDLLDASQVTAGTKMQNSILQLDNAQTELRNKLLNYKSTYSEVDSRYTATKAERKAAKKQIRYAEKKIKNLETAKKKIRKNFQRNMNI